MIIACNVLGTEKVVNVYKIVYGERKNWMVCTTRKEAMTEEPQGEPQE